MSSFTRKLSTTQVSIKPRLWRLDRDFRYYVGEENSEYYFDVDEGFVFNGGTIPRFAWWVDAPNGDGAQAYCLHDALYGSRIVSREEADRILEEGLEVLGLNWCRRKIIMSAVRICGGFAWASVSKEEIATVKRYVHMYGESLADKINN